MNDMKPFGELSDAEKGALLLAHHEGKRIEFFDLYSYRGWRESQEPEWAPIVAYRIAPEPLIPDSINWDHVAPEWKFMARDESGNAWLYDCTPDRTPSRAHWNAGSGISVRASAVFASYRRGTVEWRDSLVRRPS